MAALIFGNILDELARQMAVHSGSWGTIFIKGTSINSTFKELPREVQQ